jgi:multicomponent K+:H+ antiporter subunit G
MWLELIISFFIISGGTFTLLGSIGLARLPDFFCRLHAPTKATTLGVGGMLLASALYFSFRDGTLSVHELMIALFLFISAPISAHMLAKTALYLEHSGIWDSLRDEPGRKS